MGDSPEGDREIPYIGEEGRSTGVRSAWVIGSLGFAVEVSGCGQVY